GRAVGRRDHASRNREQLFSVARRVRPLWLGSRLSQNGSRSAYGSLGHETERSPLRCVGPIQGEAMIPDQSNQVPTATSRAVRLESFGGPEVLDVREVSA